MKLLTKLAAAASASIIILASITAPANAATTSGTLNCPAYRYANLTTYSHSALTHTHTYKAPSGATTMRYAYSTINGHTVSPYVQNSWTASNGSHEAWRANPWSRCVA